MTSGQQHPASTPPLSQRWNFINPMLVRIATSVSSMGGQSFESTYISKSTTLRSHDPLLPRFLITPALEERRTFRDSRIIPPTGSRPKYFTVISCPTDKPRTLGWLTYKYHKKEVFSTIARKQMYSIIIEKTVCLLLISNNNAKNCSIVLTIL